MWHHTVLMLATAAFAAVGEHLPLETADDFSTSRGTETQGYGDPLKMPQNGTDSEAPQGGRSDSCFGLLSPPLAHHGDPGWLSQEMIDWVNGLVPAHAAPEVRLRRLYRALVGPHGLAIEEVEGTTPTAAEAFRARRANCVAFAHLFVALARQLGVAVTFIETADGSLRRAGSHRLQVRHMAVAFPDRGLVFDLGGIRRLRDSGAQHLSDHEASAIYFMNRGAERLLVGDPEGAVAWARCSVVLAPSLESAKRNLAVALRASMGTSP